MGFRMDFFVEIKNLPSLAKYTKLLVLNFFVIQRDTEREREREREREKENSSLLWLIIEALIGLITGYEP